MNQYGYVPYAASRMLREHYSIADPTTWTIHRDEGGDQAALYGGVEEVVFSEAQKAELTALGGGWFSSLAEFYVWHEYAALADTNQDGIITTEERLSWVQRIQRFLGL